MISKANAESLSTASAGPITITAEDGVEWNQPENTIIARGNAVVTRDKMKLESQQISAKYRKNERGSVEIFNITATGEVTFTSPEGTAYGNVIEYDFDNAKITLKGEPAKLKHGGETLTAQDSIEYLVNEKTAYAYGRAYIKRKDSTLEANTIKAIFKPTQKGAESIELSTMEGNGNVVMTTKRETVKANYATYSVKNSIATLNGSVRINQDKNELKGDFAEVNLKTGISRLIAKKGEKGSKRVSGSISPQDKSLKEKTP